MDDKTKNILSALSPAYAISQGKSLGVMGLIGNERSRRKNKKEEAKQKLIDESAKAPVTPPMPEPQMMRKGGKVRGAGKARQGVRPCKMR